MSATSDANAMSVAVRKNEIAAKGSLNHPEILKDEIFRFMDLPAEMRNRVYNQITRETKVPRELRASFLWCLAFDHAPTIPMLLVSKQVKAECEKELSLSSGVQIVFEKLPAKTNNDAITTLVSSDMTKTQKTFVAEHLARSKYIWLAVSTVALFEHPDGTVDKSLQSFFVSILPIFTSLKFMSVNWTLPFFSLHLAMEEGRSFAVTTPGRFKHTYLGAFPDNVKNLVRVYTQVVFCLRAYTPRHRTDDVFFEDWDPLISHRMNLVHYVAPISRQRRKIRLYHRGLGYGAFQVALVDLGLGEEGDRKYLKELEEWQPGCTDSSMFASGGSSGLSWEIDFDDLTYDKGFAWE